MSGNDIRLVQDAVPEGEPFYIRQHGAFAELTEKERHAWFKNADMEATMQGAHWLRYSLDNPRAPTMALVEGWELRPVNEGAIRWQLTLSKVEDKA